MTYVEIIRVVFIVVHVYYKYYDSMPSFWPKILYPRVEYFYPT